MASELPTVLFDEDNPEWTAEDFARARPAQDVLPPEVIEAFNRKPGRPAGSDKQQVTVRLDKDVLAHFRAGGAGWQTRINAALRASAGL